jgi:uncharacterized membrane protein YecN with MAPEG domain
MISTPTTSPSSDGATSASVTIASITPRDLSDQYGAVDTAAKLSPSTLSSTPSLSPENTHAAADAAGSGNSNQDRPVNNRNRRFSRLESVFGLTHAEGKDADLTRMMCGSMFAYVVLGIWIWTVFQFIVLISRHQCTAAYTDIGAKAVSAASNVGSSNNLGTEYASAAMTCIEHFNGSLACAHSITFGLISAVVIHETGSSDESAKQRLTSMIQPMVRRQKIDANFFQRSVSTLITSLPTVYVVSWTIFGLTCFIYSITSPDGSTGPLFYTGQTWIGLIIKVTYSFFGIEPQDNASTPPNPSAAGQNHLGRQGRGEV